MAAAREQTTAVDCRYLQIPQNAGRNSSAGVPEPALDRFELNALKPCDAEANSRQLQSTATMGFISQSAASMQNIGHRNQSVPFLLSWRLHRLGDGQHPYEVLCLADRSQADAFRDVIQGEEFDPRDRLGGRWLRGRGATRDAKRKARGLW